MLESIRTRIGTAELCCKHNVHPQTFQTWRQKFMDGGKSNLSTHGKNDPVMTVKKEDNDLKRIIGELGIANDVLKKPWRQTEIERSQDDAQTVEPAQILGVCRCLKT